MFDRITVTLPTEAQSLRFWQLQGDEIHSQYRWEANNKHMKLKGRVCE